MRRVCHQVKMGNYRRLVVLLCAFISSAAFASELVAAPSTVINVWCVGSPFTQEVPGTCAHPLIGQQAQKLGYTVAVENIRAVDFVARFRHAVQENKPPEILMFNNFGVLTGVSSPAGNFEGLLQREPTIAASLTMVYETLTPFQPGGWWTMLVSSAANYDAARRMALGPLSCPIPSGSSRLASSELASLSELATHASGAYLVGDNASLAAASDEARLGNKSFLPGTNVTVEKLQVCSVYGNERLAFVALAGTFFTTRRPLSPTRNFNYAWWLTNTPLGQQSLLAVFRKHQGQWRLLTISDDPVNTGYSGRATAGALERLTGLMSVDHTSASTSARLVTPAGAKVTPPPNVRFGDFEWSPSPDATVVCEVAEFLVGDNLFPRDRTRLFFFFGREQQLSAGKLWGRAGRWRVWSISKSGDVALSETRAYRTH